MNWRNKKYYVLEIRYKANGFLMDEVEYYRSEKRAQRICAELNAELETLEEVVMINKPFVGKGIISFSPNDLYYTVSMPRCPMIPERKREKNRILQLFQ